MSADGARGAAAAAPASGEASKSVADLEADLWVRFQSSKSQAARDRLFAHYAPFARQVAGRHFRDRRGADIEFPDLCQLAYAGLLEAVDRFDSTRGVPFKGYAGRRISGNILDGLSKMSELREQASFRHRARYERTRSLMTEGPQPRSADDILAALADLALGLAIGFILEDAGVYTPEDAPARQFDAYESVAFADTINQVKAALADLTPRERAVIEGHYFNDLDFSQISAVLGLGRSRISQLHKAAIGSLKARLSAGGQFWLQQ